MKSNLAVTGMTIGMAVMGLGVLAPEAMACGSFGSPAPAGVRANLAPRALPSNIGAAPRAGRPQDDSEEPSMTGLWKSVLVSDGQVMMVEFDTWHNDGTELGLDGLFPPVTGQVCPGVWEKTGTRTYDTAHPAFEYDSTNTQVVAIFIERMHVTISADGNSFEGTFTWDNYDFNGNLLPGSVSGTVTGSRIRVSAAFPFPFPL